MPTKNKRIFASDVHLGMVADLRGGSPFVWLDDDDAAARDFALFLRAVSQDPAVAEVVLLGDIFDNWVCPLELTPPTMAELLAARQGKTVMAALAEAAANDNLKMRYYPGNHDMDITEAIFKQYLPQIEFGGLVCDSCCYGDGGVHAEHGDAYSMFNAPDIWNHSPGNLPLGYFMARLAAQNVWRQPPAPPMGLAAPLAAWRTIAAPFAARRTIAEVLRELGDMITVRAAWNAERIYCHVTPTDVFRMPSGMGDDICAADVEKRYSDLFGEWSDAKDDPGAEAGIAVELHDFNPILPRLADATGANIIIFGHSHRADLRWVVPQPKKPTLYANCGAWCEKNKPRTYVEIETVDNGKIVRLIEWRDGAKVTPFMGEEHVQ